MTASLPVATSAVCSTKGHHIRDFIRRKRQQTLELADYVERNPKSLQVAAGHVEKFLASPAHIRIHWVLSQWSSVLRSSDTHQVAALLRSDSPDTEFLRESPPYFGPRDC